MLSRIARGVPRFSITSERLSLSTRFSSLPKLDLARRAEITILFFAAALALGINSPVHLSELYSYKFHLSMATHHPKRVHRAGKGEACRRRGRPGRGGGRRVLRRSSGPRACVPVVAT